MKKDDFPSRTRFRIKRAERKETDPDSYDHDFGIADGQMEDQTTPETNNANNDLADAIISPSDADADNPDQWGDVNDSFFDGINNRYNSTEDWSSNYDEGMVNALQQSCDEFYDEEDRKVIDNEEGEINLPEVLRRKDTCVHRMAYICGHADLLVINCESILLQNDLVVQNC